jgi:CheY-like chemotaxis protein
VKEKGEEGKKGGRGKGERGRRKGSGLDTSVPSASRAKNTATPPLSILFLGDALRPEFQESRVCLNAWGAVAEFIDPDIAAAALAENRVSPDLVVVAQSFPGQFSHQMIDRLRRLTPLARVLGLMGSWCEGEMRSGSPWPATLRTYWHQWPTRCNRQLRRLATGRSCSWALPPTATEEERLLADASSRRPGIADSRADLTDSGADIPVCPGGPVVIHSPSREMADWLSAACRDRGLSALWQRDSALARVEGASAGIFDAADPCDDQCDSLRRFAAALRPAPIVALLSFPRIEDHQRAMSAGASVVLSKPVAADDLLACIFHHSGANIPVCPGDFSQ